MENTCSQCGVTISGAEILYTAQGAAICRNCTLKGEIKQSEARAAANAPQSALRTFGAGFIARSILSVIVILAVLLALYLRRKAG